MDLPFYTDEILTKNFLKLAEFNDDAAAAIKNLLILSERHDAAINSLDHAIGDLYGRINQLSKASKIVVKTKGRSKLVLLGVVAGSVYVGYQMATIKIDEEKAKRFSDKAANKVVDKIEDTLYGKKPANTETKKD